MTEESTKEESTKEESTKEESTKEESTKEESTKEESTKEESTKEESTKEEFQSLCGFPFDHAKNSDCFTVCKKDEPEDFARCLSHFQTLVVKPKAKTSTAKGGRGKSKWNHINGTQAGLIDDRLVQAEKPVTIQEIAEFANGKLPRVLAHVKYLVKTKGATISLTKDNCIFWDDNINMKGLKSAGCVTGLFLKKAPAKPKEDKALKDAEKAIEEEEKALKDAEKAIEEEEKEEGVVKKDAFAKIKLPADKTKTADKDKKDKPVVKPRKATPKTKEVAKVKA